MKHTILAVATYRAATTSRAIDEHFNELLAKTTKVITVGDGSIISIRNQAGLSRHSLPIMIPADRTRNTFDKNIFFLDTFGLKDNEADFMYSATLLTAIWEDPTINETFASVHRLSAGLYNQWVAGGYIRQFGLDYSDADKIKVVVGLYYQFQGQQVNVEEWRSEEIYRVVSQVADASGVPNKDVKEIMEKYDLLAEPVVLNFDWLLENLMLVSDILKYRMNRISALTMVSNGWYRGMVAQPQLALNYKPFFIAMLYTAFTDRTAARTGIDIMIKGALEGRRRQQADTFVGAIDAIIKEQTAK